MSTLSIFRLLKLYPLKIFLLKIIGLTELLAFVFCIPERAVTFVVTNHISLQYLVTRLRPGPGDCWPGPGCLSVSARLEHRKMLLRPKISHRYQKMSELGRDVKIQGDRKDYDSEMRPVHSGQWSGQNSPETKIHKCVRLLSDFVRLLSDDLES